MKTLSILTFICFLSSYAYADCASSGIWAWPETGTITETPVITLEGYYTDQKVIRNIGKTYQLYLKSDDGLIPLEPIEILEGQMYLTQVMLKPSKILEDGKEYELFATSIPKASTVLPQTLNFNLPDSKWTVKATNDALAPNFKSPPSLSESSVIFFGCGPANYMHFTFTAKEQTPLLVKTTVINTTDNSQSTYYLEAKEGKLSVGHGMCSGAFKPQQGVKYKVEFSLLDNSWNKGNTVSCEVVYSPKQGY